MLYISCGRKDFVKEYSLGNASCNWVQKFSEGRSNVVDKEQSGRHLQIFIEEKTVQKIGEMIKANKRLTINDPTTAIGYSHVLGYSIMHESMGMKILVVCIG